MNELREFIRITGEVTWAQSGSLEERARQSPTVMCMAYSDYSKASNELYGWKHYPSHRLDRKPEH